MSRPGSDLAEGLERLWALRTSGALSDEEYERAKTALLNGERLAVSGQENAQPEGRADGSDWAARSPARRTAEGSSERGAAVRIPGAVAMWIVVGVIFVVVLLIATVMDGIPPLLRGLLCIGWLGVSGALWLGRTLARVHR